LTQSGMTGNEKTWKFFWRFASTSCLSIVRRWFPRACYRSSANA